MSNDTPQGSSPDASLPPGAKTYDSPLTRRLESIISARWDMEFVRACAFFINEMGEQRSYRPRGSRLADAVVLRVYEELHTRQALWNAAIVRLFRHYTNEPVQEVRDAYEATLEQHPDLRRPFQLWRAERDKTIAHPIGYGESHFFFLTADSPPQVRALSMLGLGDLVKGDAERLLRFASTAHDLLSKSYDSLFAALKEEVASLIPDEIAYLSPARIRTHGRRYGAGSR